MPDLVARLEPLPVTIDQASRVVINERTGTVVIGGGVRLGPAAVAHGNLSVRISTQYDVSQPAPFARRGETVVVPDERVDVSEGDAKLVNLGAGTTLTPWCARSTRWARRRATSSPSFRRSRRPARWPPRS